MTKCHNISCHTVFDNRCLVQWVALQVQEVPVQLLPGLSANAGQPWDPNLLLGFGDAVLSWIAAAAQQQPGQQLLVSYRKDSKEIHVAAAENGSMAQRLAQLLPQ
jgi:hypothetical protein